MICIKFGFSVAKPPGSHYGLNIMTHDIFQLLAPAKINLFLHVTGKRTDGYHLLQSIMAFADVGDALTFKPQETFSLEITGAFAAQLSAGGDNLVFKAAAALAREFGVAPSGQVTLQKNLPIASGIGGGSSDAATTLRGLACLWDLPDDPARLQKVAVSLGADVPACLVAQTVFAEGIGEYLTVLPTPSLHAVLVNPGTTTATPEVFKHFSSAFTDPIDDFVVDRTAHEFIAQLAEYRNDLTAAACQVNPDIAAVLNTLGQTAGQRLVRMSGSGATCFALYDDAPSAHRAAQDMHSAQPGWWVCACQIGTVG